MLDSQIFTSEEALENSKKINKLIALIASGDSILMAGAGTSASIYPDWPKFIEKLKEEAIEVDPNFSCESDYLEIANKVKTTVGTKRYYALIYREFSPKNPTHKEFHEILCKLPFKGIITTNYDSVLEYALMAVAEKYYEASLHIDGTISVKLYEFLLSLGYNDLSIPKMVLHFHGKYDIEDSIILCGNEYTEKYGFVAKTPDGSLYEEIQSGKISKEQLDEFLFRYGYKWPIRRKLLWSILATRRVVFVGFSMRDPYFIKMLDFVRDDLSTFHFDTHFLILRITEEDRLETKAFAKKIKSDYGIETVFFEDDDTYLGLERFIGKIGNDILLGERDEPKIANITSKPIPIEVDEDEELTEHLLEIAKQKDRNEDQ